VTGLLAPCLAQAQTSTTSPVSSVKIGFSNLIARLDSDEIGFAKAEYRVHILEALRKGGFNAVGAESLVFGRDDGEHADLVLGGTVRELECRPVRRQTNCRVGIEWELLDREKDAVVYRVLTRYMQPALDPNNHAVSGKQLVLGALRTLMSYPHITKLLRERREVVADEGRYPIAGFRACAAPERELPAQFNEVADATYVVKVAGGFGSGFGISPDGLVLTAAHVVSGKTVQLVRRGDTTTITGTVLRLARKHDVALIAIAAPAGTPQPCVALQSTPPSAGDDVYAIGSPASQDLAFSLTRGIVSGLRLLEGVQLVQTDASLSPGNSGGPLLNRQANVVGVVTRKIAGRAVEGLGFGVQIQDALQALKIQPEATTSASLMQATATPSSEAPGRSVFVDVTTRMPSLDPEGDQEREAAADEARRLQERRDATPWFVKPMRWTGLSATIIGSLGILVSTASGSKERISRADFEMYRTQNDISWALFALGTAAFVVSYPLEPALPPARDAKRVSNARPIRWSLALGAGQLNVKVGL
jgi:serine protease Do